jgi:hypothetical protein
MSLLQRELAKIREALLEETDTLLLHSMHPMSRSPKHSILICGPLQRGQVPKLSFMGSPSCRRRAASASTVSGAR